MNKYEHPTGTLAITYHTPKEETSPYVQFEYTPQTICELTQGKVSVSMNTDLVNANKQVKDQRNKDENQKSKEQYF